jgi:hypothetical protein
MVLPWGDGLGQQARLPPSFENRNEFVEFVGFVGFVGFVEFVELKAWSRVEKRRVE